MILGLCSISIANSGPVVKTIFKFTIIFQMGVSTFSQNVTSYLFFNNIRDYVAKKVFQKGEPGKTVQLGQ